MSLPSSDVVTRSRVICDNDYCGDPDGIVQLAHHLLSPSVDVRAVIGSAVAHYDLSWTTTSAEHSVSAARSVVALARRDHIPIVPGSNEPLQNRSAARPSPAAELIIDEAMRNDSDLPLYLTCGGGLTNVASAWLMEPRIAGRFTLVWIGGPEHSGLSQSPEPSFPFEYNLSIDPLAAQVVFNDSDLDLWQVPVDAYKQMLVSRSELLRRVDPMGPLGAHLFGAIEETRTTLAAVGYQLGETYVLGDSPLVLLTSLLGSFDAVPSSSRWVERRCPRINDDGHYEPGMTERTIRVFTHLDTRLVTEDLYAKLEIAAARA